jgi:hypothetical protein
MRGGDLPAPDLMTEPPPPPPAGLGDDGPREWGPHGELMPVEPGRGRRPAPSGAAPYVELHAHSAFSFLDGASTPLELAVAAAELGYPAIALTDHDGIWGSLEFAHACRGLGVRAITGAEVTVGLERHPAAPGHGSEGPQKIRSLGADSSGSEDAAGSYLAHLTLLVETPAGYRNLCRLCTSILLGDRIVSSDLASTAALRGRSSAVRERFTHTI